MVFYRSAGHRAFRARERPGWPPESSCRELLRRNARRHRMNPSSPALNRSSGAAVTEIPMLIGGEWRFAAEAYDVRDPYRGTIVASAPKSSAKDLDDALDAAVKAKAKAATMPAYERAALLRRAATLLVERADRIAEIM